MMVFLVSTLSAVVTFERTWWFDAGNDYCYSLAQLADGSYIVLTEVDGAVGMAAGLIRVDSLGDTLWFRKYEPPSGGAIGDGVCATLDGCFVIAGHKGGVGVSDAWGAKVSDSGDTVWSYTYEGPGYDYFSSVAATHDTGSIFCGTLTISSDRGLGLAKVNRNGETSWLRVYPAPRPDAASGGANGFETADRGFLAFGGFAAPWPNDTNFVFIVRTDSTGDTLWTRTFRPAHRYIESGSMCATHDGGAAFCGTSAGGGSAGFLVRLDSLGDSLWGRELFRDSVSHGQVWLNCVQETPDRGFAIAGYLEREGGADPDTGRALLVRLDSLGDTLWTREFDGVDPVALDRAYWVVNTRDGGFAISGLADVKLAYLIKTDSLGLVYNAVSETRPAAARCAQLLLRPNPFSRSALVNFQISVSGRVLAQVFDISGRALATLVDAEMLAGTVEAIWTPEKLASGVYLLRLSLPDGSATGRLVLLR